MTSPVKKLLVRAAVLKREHEERHRPSGFALALADAVDQLDGASWDGLAEPHSFFMTRPYLRVLETDGPDNVRPRYALVFRERKPVAAVVAQLVGIPASKMVAAKNPAQRKALEQVGARLLVCGNLLSWGQHATAFAAGENPAELWPGVAEALYRIRRGDALSGGADFTMVKDLADAEPRGVDALWRFSYKPLATDPNMVLELKPSWTTYEAYLASMKSDYRKDFLKIAKKIEAAGATVERLADPAAHAARLHELYLEVHEAASVKPATLPAGYFAGLARAAGDKMRWTAIRRGGEILGFISTLKDGDTAVGYYVGFERARRDEMPLYFRLLQCVVEDAIAFGCKRISFGRTALEPKAKLGCRPEPTSVWVRHTNPFLNSLVAPLLDLVPHGEAPERNPFKDPSA